MLRPVIFIGCGGSGTKAVRYVREAVLRRLAHRGWDRGVPDAWQFIGLDTLTVQESPTEIPTIPAEDFLSLSANFATYKGLCDALTARHPVGGPSRDARLLCGWLPDPRAVNVPLKDGAGQNRGIGRAAGLLSLEATLLGRLRTAFQRAAAGGPLLREVGDYLGVEAEVGGETAAPLVAVCSSMAGGTGAGVALDVIDLVRACDPAGRHPALVLFTNDIFDLPDSRPMAANSLGLMSEMLAAYWSEPGEIESPLKTQTVQDPGVGPHSIFLVGRYSYSDADLGDTAEVYRAVGEALSTWVVDATVQEDIHTFINVNWRTLANDNKGGYPFGQEQRFGAVSSFGAAKVTVGRDRFSHWAEHLLAREALDSLSKGHLRLSHFAELSRDDTEQELIDKAGRRHAEDIHHGRLSGSRPPGGQRQGCASAPEAFAGDEELREVRAQVRAALEFPPSQRAGGDRWSDLLSRRGGDQADEWRQKAESRRDPGWCEAMLAATCRSVSEVAARASLDVAAAALGHVIEEINPAEVNKARDRAKSDGLRYRKDVEAALNALSAHDGDLTGDSPQVREATDGIARGVAYQWRSLRRRAAADTMEAAGDQVFGAIRRAVLAARAEVGIALGEDDVKAWPTAVNDIAKRYLPSTVELPLEKHDAWPGLIGELCAEADPGGVSHGNLSTDPLRHRLIAGDSEMAPLVSPGRHSRWQPGQHADVVCHAGAQDVEERVHRWTRRPGAKFNRVVSEGLRSYLAETDPDTGERRIDHARRMEVFREQIGKAKQAADPLMRIDLDIHNETHKTSLKPFLTVCSQFPFGEGHPAETAARAIIGDASFKASVQDTPSVLISSYIESPIYPMAVRSFTEPVAKALQESPDPSHRSSGFWMWRRGRTLEAFVPLPREALRAMISGFAVARLCGYVTADPNKAIRITAGPDAAEFPWPLLTTLRNYDDLLAALLESFSLTFGMVGSDGMRVYECYRRLHELGLPSLRGRLHQDLQKLLESGEPPHPTVGSETPRATGDSPQERREEAVRYLDDNLDYFRQQHPDKMREHMMRGIDGSAESGAMTTELAPIYLECYGTLRDLLSGRSPTGSVI